MTKDGRTKDAYSILGVKRSADREAIKHAYRQLARERHPDLDPGNPWAEEEFKELAAAYAVLSDPVSRLAYDKGEVDLYGNRLRRSAGSSGSGAQAGRRSSGNPFDDYLKRREQRRRRAGGSESGRDGVKVDGANVDYPLRIGFLEAARGAEKHISTTSGKRLKVVVPPGTADGRVLRLKGQGMAGIGGGRDGDAHVTVEVAPHPLFRADGADVRSEASITLPEAVLGGRIEVATVDGAVSVTVPAGSNTGSTLRLRGKGLATGAKGDGPRGDHYVKLMVVLPAKPDADLKAFVETWGPAHPYSVRRTTSKVDGD